MYSPLPPPCCLTRSIQQTVYCLDEKPAAINYCLIVTVALLGLSLLSLSLLNHYHKIHLFSYQKQWQAMTLGILFSALPLPALAVYICTRKYKRNHSAPNLDEDVRFIRERPQWYQTELGPSFTNGLRKNTRYHDWYKFRTEKSDGFHHCRDMPQVAFVKNPSIILKCVAKYSDSHFSYAQCVYKEKRECFETRNELLYEVQFPIIPERYHIPFLQGSTLFIENWSGSCWQIVAFDIASRETTPLFVLDPREKVSHIRCCNSILLLGYESGLVQLIDHSSGEIVASYRAKGQVLDAWIDPENRRVEIYSSHPLSFICFYGRGRVREVWQF